MENVPWHQDVKGFSEALAMKSGGKYEVACEHAHSVCVLLAKVDDFKINGQWFTWIDYEKFHNLVGSRKSFWNSFITTKLVPYTHLYSFIVNTKFRWHLASLSRPKITCPKPHHGPHMVQKRVDLIRNKFATRRSAVMVQKLLRVRYLSIYDNHHVFFPT